MHQMTMIHESLPLSPIKSPENILFNHHHSSSHSSFPVISVVIVGILATSFLLVFYYIFVIRCCLNWHRIGILRRFSPSQNHPTLPFMETRVAAGLDETIIRSIPIFRFRRAADDQKGVSCECAVCLNEFQEDEMLRFIPNCAHIFHIDCIDVWLQNNPNCPLCRSTVSSVTSKPQTPHHFSTISSSLNHPPPLSSDAANHDHDNTTSASNIARNFNEDDVVIELPFCGGAADSRDVQACLGAQDSMHRLSMIPRKMGKKEKRKGLAHVSSMGDECIDVDTSGDQFHEIKQPIRRSFSMDSASERHVYSTIREILQHKNAGKNMNDDCCEVLDGSSSSRGVKRSTSFFSLGHGRGSRSAVLPVLHFESRQTLDR